MAGLASWLVKRAYRVFVLAPLGYGRPRSREFWEGQYRDGTWDYLESLPELPRSMIIVGYVSHLFPSPAVLDVGCGHGRLMRLLSAFGFRSYVGLDISAEALRKAEAAGIPNTRFEVADFEQWVPAERFDVIVFSEALYYARRPEAVLARYAEALTDGGALIVSMFRHSNCGVIWRNLAKRFRTVQSASIENQLGQVWDIRVLQPTHAPGDSPAPPRARREAGGPADGRAAPAQ